MKVLIVYSSKTGNTRKLAKAIHLALPEAHLCPVSYAPDPAGYDLIFMGCWIEQGTADEAAQNYMSRLHNRTMALFATLGAYPDSRHAVESMDAVCALLPTCQVIDRFICQGAIDPELIEWMQQLPKDHGYGPTESRKKLWQDAETHPDEADLKAVSEWALGVLSAV